jgi:phosphopantothenoylcysteine decarboxylase/phosphopantothenate--cysteine ligase
MMTELSSGGGGARVHVALGVSGCIGAYKSAGMVRALRTAGAAVTVLMTSNAANFITPLTLQTLSGNRVLLNQFDGVNHEWDVEHVSLAKKASCLLVAPATANIIGKFANGIADDFLSTFYTAYDGPVIVAPAMNTVMYQHPAVRHNLDLLRRRGVEIIEPESGFLACGDIGTGRLADPEDIVQRVLDTISAKELDLLRGIRVTVTAGPTRESIDPVRFLTNHSSGKMGYALARQAARLGAEVTLISGPAALTPPAGVRLVKVFSCAEMHGEVLQTFPDTDLLLMAAAPADYRPRCVAGEKIRKGAEPLLLNLQRTDDILLDACRQKKDQIVVGFAAETAESFEASALEKLQRKGLDFILANRVGQPGSGFGTDENAGVLLGRDGSRTELPLMTKDRMARAILKLAGAACHDREKGK